MANSVSSEWKGRHRLWLDFVQGIADGVSAGNNLPTGPSPTPLIPHHFPTPRQGAPKVVLCSPHPDDEALVSALALRLRIEDDAEIVNCAVTLGSEVREKPRRLSEVQASCLALGFRLVVPRHPRGFDAVTADTRQNAMRTWDGNVSAMADIFDQERPNVVFFPHAQDFHPRHIGTHYLTLDALSVHLKRTGRQSVLLIETEYWHEIENPNLMVGLTAELVAVQVMAVAEHGGEVARNPYHLRQPARLIDNVRRGSEVVCGPGAAGSTLVFAELYRASLMSGEKIVPAMTTGRAVDATEKVGVLTLLSDFYPQISKKNELT